MYLVFLNAMTTFYNRSLKQTKQIIKTHFIKVGPSNILSTCNIVNGTFFEKKKHCFVVELTFLSISFLGRADLQHRNIIQHETVFSSLKRPFYIIQAEK